MSFNIALTGLFASQKDLDVTANNIANVLTTGFKESRGEFADVFASSTFGNNGTLAGNGVRTSAVAQLFSQGSLQSTDNALDMGISGTGFFLLSDSLVDLQRYYTRAGAFKLDKDSYLVNNEGRYLQSYQVNEDSGIPQAVAVDSTRALQIDDTSGQPAATTTVSLAMNLSSDAVAIPATATFDPTDDTTFNTATAITIYDSLGESHLVELYFVKSSAVPNQWRAYPRLDNNTLQFDPALTSASTADDIGFLTIQYDTAGSNPSIYLGTNTAATNLVTEVLGGIYTNGAEKSQRFTLNFDTAATTQFVSPSIIELTELSQNGSTTGRLTRVDIGKDGLVLASYSNGTRRYLGQIAMARFANEQGLTQIGDTTWRESLTSGEALAGQGNTGVFGKVESSNLEVSNVDLSTELVDLIRAQRNYQANSRTLEVNSTLQQTLLQIR